jgi:DNA polymerase-1
MVTLLAVDGTNLVMRSLKAMQGRQTVLAHEGVNTGPLMVFVRMFNRYVQHVRPTHVAVCWDAPGRTWREDMASEYKANRAHRSSDEEDERTSAFGLVRRWLALSDVYMVQERGFEADDLVASLARSYVAGTTVILSGDKDLLQLVRTDRILQIRPQTGMTPTDETWDENRVVERYGISGSDLALAAALTGDKSDNVIGVRGIGPKTAATLVKASSGNIDRLVEMQRCADHRDVILRNHKLVDLCKPMITPGVPVLPPFRPANHGSLSWVALQEFLRGLALTSLLEVETGWGVE